jgi:drug/metabolite transporter (DMT)-like permease
MYESLVLLSEVILSSYPVLIKKVDAPLFTQTGVRMGVFTALATLAGFVSGGTPLSGITATETLATGLLNLVHVGSSYKAFEALAAGNAMALFYTYPLWNMLGASIFFGESVSAQSIPWIILAMLGAVLLSRPSISNWSTVGVVAALIAAITESAIYLWFRQTGREEPTPWKTMTAMYGGSLVLWGILSLIAGAPSTSVRNLSSMVLFNVFVGFLGYAVRFYAIPKVSTVLFSALSFFGVISAYMFGWMFMGEVPSGIQMLGAAAIIAANAVLVKREIV